MIGASLSAFLSHWRRNPLQFLTLLGGLILATALWCGVQAINAEARASYDAAAATVGEGRFDQLVPRDGDIIPQDAFIALRRAGWLVGPVLEGRIRTENGSVRVVGLDPLTSPSGLGPIAQGGDFDLTEFLTTRPVFVNGETANRLKDSDTPPLILDADLAPGTALTDIGTAQEWLGRPGELSRLVLLPNQPKGVPELADIAPNLVRQVAQGGSDIGRLTDSFHLNLTAFGLLSFAVGIFIVHGAIGLAFEQRRPMIRTLRAMGVPMRLVAGLMIGELLAIALIGGLIGIMLGYVIASALLPDVAATIRGLYGAQVSGTLQLRPVWWLSGLAMCIAGALVAASGALWQILRMPLLASGQSRAWSMASGIGRRRQGLLALILLTLVPILAVSSAGLVAGFALLACLLLGAALALPLLLATALRWLEGRAKGVIWHWFWADTRQQLPSLSLALMALLLAMAANVGVSTMVSSFRLTFTGFLDQRLAAELYVTAEDGAALEAFLAPRTDELLPILSVETTLADLPAELYGARIGRTYRENWQFLVASPDVWDTVAAGQSVIVNEQLARRSDLWLGDTLEVSAGLSLPIAGVFGDYGNPIGQAVITEDTFRILHPGITARQFGLRTDTADALRISLIQEHGLPEGNIIDQAGIKAFSLSVFERTFTVTAALNVLTLSVAGFAIFMALLTLASMRLPQLAPPWALGLTRRELGQFELLRAVILAALTATIALPLGLVLAWVLLAVINVEAFGWRLPMYMFPVDYARLGLFALLAALLAALWPALRLARTPPSELLKVFANAR